MLHFLRLRGYGVESTCWGSASSSKIADINSAEWDIWLEPNLWQSLAFSICIIFRNRFKEHDDDDIGLQERNNVEANDEEMNKFASENNEEDFDTVPDDPIVEGII